METLQHGALEDIRSQEEKEKDYESREIATAIAVLWEEKTPEQWRKFEIFDQSTSGSCVGQGVSKALGVENLREENYFLRLSARDIYSRRTNQDTMGMYFPNAMEIAIKHGATLETLLPSEGRGEVLMNDKSDYAPSKDQVAQVFKAGGYVSFKTYDIDEIASVIQNTGKAIVLGFRFDYDEWTNKPFINPASNKSLGHCVTAVDFTLSDGEKCLVIEDSWGGATAIQGRRLITQQFITERCFYAGYFVDLSNNWRDTGTPIAFHFTQTMKYGDISDEVVKLQNFLKSKGFFPTIDSTGKYLAITAKAVLKWQLANIDKFIAIDPTVTVENLTALGGKFFGDKSLQVINQ